MVPSLCIVARDQLDLYGYFRHRFADEPDVQVILDRRQGGDPSAGSVEIHEPGRWRTDRRRRPRIEEKLRSVGYAVILTDAEPAVMADPRRV